MRVAAILLLLGASSVGASVTQMDAQANPIRKVVTLLQDMQGEIAKAGEEEKGLYDKYMCFCEQTNAALGGAATKAGATIDDVSAKLEEDSSSKTAIDQELAGVAMFIPGFLFLLLNLSSLQHD